jgi:flagellar biosynthetic protein FliQ
MEANVATHLLREAIHLVLVLSAIPLLAAAIVGLCSALVQAMTQVQDYTLSHLPKQLVLFVVLALTLPWMGAQMSSFTRRLFELISTIR